MIQIHSSLLLLALSASSLFAQAPLTPGNLVVVRVGTGAAALTNASTAVFLDELTPSGALVQSIPLPTVAAGANQPLTMSGTATAECFLTLDASGQYLLCGGYAAAPGIASINSSTAVAAPRVVGRIDLAGNVDTSSTLGTALSGLNMRSVASPDGFQFYATSNNSGVQYSVYGTNTAIALNTVTPTNTRVAQVFAGQLYVSSASSTYFGVSALGTGLPNSSGQTATLLPGFPVTTGPSSYDFFFADANTLYVADDRAAASGGGIQKWTFAAGTWSLAYTLGNIGVRGLTGQSSCGVTTLYATTTTNSIVSVVDTGIGAPFAPVATAGTNTVFRGLRRLPFLPGFQVVGTGSPSSGGVPTIGTIGSPVVGNLTWGCTSSNWPAFIPGGLVVTIGSVLPGIQIPGAQPGALLYAPVPETLLFIAFADVSGNVVQPVGIPCDPVFAGVQAALQWIVLDPSLAFPLQFATSPGVQLTVGD